MKDPTSITPLAGERCLVTGAAGFLARHLIDALRERGCEVHALDILDEAEAREGVVWFKGDVRDAASLARACEGVDTIFHTAAIIELASLAPRSFASTVRSINVGGTTALLEAAREAGVRRFVHTSSTSAVFREQTVGGDERGPYSRSDDLYSSTKAESERAVLSADGVGGMHTCALRPGGIYGPGERNALIGPLCDAMAKGSPIICFGDGSSLLDYTFVDNLVDAQLRAAERLVPGSAACGQAYFITDGQPINPGAFSIELVGLMQIGKKVLRIPARVASFLGFVLELVFWLFGARPMLTRVHVALAVNDNYFSIEKAARDLDYAPLLDTSEGIRRTAPEAREYYLSRAKG